LFIRKKRGKLSNSRYKMECKEVGKIKVENYN